LIFTGTFENKVDAKGRVSIPAPFRALIKASKSGQIALFPSFRYNGLEGMSLDMLTALASQNAAVNPFAKGKTNPYSVLFRSALTLGIDDAGRITLPDSLISRAALTGKAVFTGEGHSFLVWSPEAHQAQMAEDLAALAEGEGLDMLEADFAAAAAEAMA